MEVNLSEWKENMLRAAGMYPGTRPFCEFCRFLCVDEEPVECAQAVSNDEVFPCRAFEAKNDVRYSTVREAFYQAGVDDGAVAEREEASHEQYRAEPQRSEEG
jgi:hypothetical protein